jgi:uncharacterized repeat protein (TIGR02543 family)
MPSPAFAGDDQIVWEYKFFTFELNNPSDADRLPNGNTLVSIWAGGGTPGKPKVMEVDPQWNVVWKYASESSVYDADRLPNGNTLICEQANNNRVIEVDASGNIVWDYSIGWPTDAERLPNGNTLICGKTPEDPWPQRSVIEVDPGGSVVWRYTGQEFVRFERLDSDNILIVEQGNKRIIEVNRSKEIVWEYSGFEGPTDTQRLPNGNTLICGGPYNKKRVVEVDPGGSVVWEYELEGAYYPLAVERLTNNNTMICHYAGGGCKPPARVFEIDYDKNVIWELYTIDARLSDAERLSNGNTLIADWYGKPVSRVLEVDANHNLVWEYTGDEKGVYPAGIRRLPTGNTLVADSNNARVIEVTPDKQIAWQFSTGLSYPSDAERLSNGNTLIADWYGEPSRVLEVDAGGNVVWEYTGDASGVYPAGIRRLPNGNTLIADSDNARVIEVTPSKEIVWQFSTGLGYPSDAERLSSGNTLIADWNNCCLLEVNTSGNVVWEYTGDASSIYPTGIRRLPNGNTLIADYKNARIIEIGTLSPAEYTLTTTVDPANSGSVELNPAGPTYPAGTTVTLTANPAAGYTFDQWSEDLSGSTNPATITMDANKNITAHFIPRPDLSIAGITCPPDVYADEPVIVTATVYNTGAADASAFAVCLYAGDTLLETKTVDSLAAGADADVEFTWTPAAAGTVALKAVADCGNAVEETDETNNELTKEVEVLLPADLTVTGITVPEKPEKIIAGSLVPVTVILLNNGPGEAKTFTVALYAGSIKGKKAGPEEPVGTVTVELLPAGASTAIELTWTPAEAEKYLLRAVADAGDAVKETNETNNELTIEVRVKKH